MNERAGGISVGAIAERSRNDEYFLRPGSVNIQLGINGTGRNFKNERLSSVWLRPKQTGTEPRKASFLRRNVVPMFCDDTFEVHLLRDIRHGGCFVRSNVEVEGPPAGVAGRPSRTAG